jgi:uncharacterized protein YehS (DUF1456 family)
MINNDILRRIRFTFNFSDSEMIGLFAQADSVVTRAQVSDWLKKEDDPAFLELSDSNLATFLNGFIISKRGKKEGPQPIPEEVLNNNLKLVDFRLSPHELSSFFRNPEHRKYRICQDQIMRNFLHGMQLKFHPVP